MSRRSNRPVVLLAAHFPPPVHGNALSALAMSRVLARHADTILVSIAAPNLSRGVAYHVRRMSRVGRAVATVLLSHRIDAVYISGDGGNGMIYTLFLVVAARLARKRVYLHHMAYSFLNHKSFLMSAIVRVGDPHLVHLCLCETMASDFEAMYQARHVTVCTVTFAMDDPGWLATGHGPGTPLRLGHFGNLTLEKGLERAFDTLGELLERGVDCRLILGGPTVGEAAARALEDGQLKYAGAVTYVGPVTGAGKDDVFRQTDVFLFPTLYANESYGLVAWEAMMRGIPVISYRAGCLNGNTVGAGGVVLDPDEDFASRAADACVTWLNDPIEFAAASRTAASGTRLAWLRSLEAAEACARRIAGG